MSLTSLIALPHWLRVGIKHHHGIALAVSSLRSRRSCGIGDFQDLISIIRWLSTTGFDMVQLLPINDTGEESSPYSALSSRALNPALISLDFIPHEDLSNLKALNDLPKVSYLEVSREKLKILKKYLRLHPERLKDPKFIDFYEKEKSWLKPYALFRALKHHFEEKPWWEWPSACRNYPPKLDVVLQAGIQQLEYFFAWVQCLAFSQMEQVREESDRVDVQLVGDIPILINKDSADLWSNPELFNLDVAAGAPPDMYSKEGQYWGFPTFNWDQHIKTNFKWWRERLSIAERFFHLYRIDHVVGFFRIWTIPVGKKAIEGGFMPVDERLWYDQGHKILSMMLDTTTMLPIAEDLGVVPRSTRECLFDLGIPGLKVLRWERDWEGDKHFIHPKIFSPESCATVSTHDSETLGQWWEAFPDEAQAYANLLNIPYQAKMDDETRKSILFWAHHAGSLFHINLLQEYLALFPELSWRDGSMDRINIPGTVLPSNWTFRIKPTLEELTQHHALASTLKKLTMQQ